MDIDAYTLYTTEQTAEILGVSQRLLEKWRMDGNGPQFIRLSRKCIRYRMKELIEYQDKRLASNTIYERT